MKRGMVIGQARYRMANVPGVQITLETNEMKKVAGEEKRLVHLHLVVPKCTFLEREKNWTVIFFGWSFVCMK